MAEVKFFQINEPIELGEIINKFSLNIFPENANKQIMIHGVTSLDKAQKGQLTFFSNSKYLAQFKNTKAEVCITESKYVKYAPKNTILLVCDHPYRVYGQIIDLLYPRDIPNSESIADSAKISPSTKLGKNCRIGENVVIEDDVIIGDFACIGHNSVISRSVNIGNYARIASNITISHAIIGDNIVIHSGARIGQDGFGFASDHTGHHKIQQLGLVKIGHHVEIGANATIDRGSSRDTIIGDMTKIDNLVQIGHNVEIGQGCFIVAQVGIAGSSKIGNYVALGGQVGVAGHLEIGDFSQVAAQSGVTFNIEPKQTVGGTPVLPIRDWHKLFIIFKRLLNKKD